MSFKSLEAEQQFHEKWAIIKEQRRGIMAELVKEVAPKEPEKAMPKRALAKAVVEAYHDRADEMQRTDPFLREYSDNFINAKTFANYWGDVKQKLAQEGVHVAWTIQGVFLTTSEMNIVRCFGIERATINGASERYNTRAELANKRNGMQLPAVAVQLLLPAG